MANYPAIDAHWHHHFEDFQYSSKKFYESLQTLIGEYKFPNVSCSVVSRTQGLLSGKREYLRVSTGKYAFDICAAPYGKSFFVSWWLTQSPGWLTELLAIIPLIGGWLAKKSESKTYFQMDTETMFKESIHGIVLKAVESMNAANAFRFPEEAKKIQPYKLES
ncbi:hypothetical protein [Parasediminibacterium sp. JCM 36343]|uniref:hypothetical protein n=1 Tax=Parasediminibacterium sp. JCM 36343 TaxID=3374279 RepID=UPI003979E509